MFVYGPYGRMCEVERLTDEQRAEAEMHDHIRQNCPEFAERIISLMLKGNVRNSKCNRCGDDILWSSTNNYRQPLNVDTTPHCCEIKSKQEDNPWADGECPYCGELDCDCSI